MSSRIEPHVEDANGSVKDSSVKDGKVKESHGPIDEHRIERAVREILEAIGEDPERDGLRDTPRRVAKMYADIFSGLHEDPGHHLKLTFEEGHDEMVMVKDI